MGIESAKHEAVLSNATVTEACKENFDLATYRNDLQSQPLPQRAAAVPGG
nr:hypothetical protein [Arthrobacter ulcerisalmonis]